MLTVLCSILALFAILCMEISASDQLIHPYSAIWNAGRSAGRHEIRRLLSKIQPASTATLYHANSSSYIVTKVFYGQGCDNPYFLLAMLLNNCFIEAFQGYYFKINYYQINSTSGFENVTYYNDSHCTEPFHYLIRPTSSCFLSEMNTGNYLDDYYSPVVPTLPSGSGWVERIYGTSQQCATQNVNPPHIAWFPTEFCYANEMYTCSASQGVLLNSYSNPQCEGAPTSVTSVAAIGTCSRLSNVANTSEACYTVYNCSQIDSSVETFTSSPTASSESSVLSKGAIFGIAAAAFLIVLVASVLAYNYTSCCGAKSVLHRLSTPRESMYDAESMSSPFVRTSETEMRVGAVSKCSA